jgi:hypothetical protein
MPRERSVRVTAAHNALLQGYKDAIAEHAPDMPALEILCITSQFLGQLLAVQDASRGAAVYLETINRNMEIGNAQAIGSVIAASGGKQ